MMMAPPPVFDPPVGYAWSPRADVVARLRSGRALVALAVPMVLGSVVSWLWLVTALSGTGAVFRNDTFAYPAGADVDLVRFVGPMLTEWLCLCWGVTSAVVVIVDEAQGRVPRWRGVWSWPWTHPGALLALGAVLALTPVLVLVVVVVVALVIAAADQIFALSVVTLSAVTTLAALVPLTRRAIALVVVGTRRRPGVVSDVPPVRGTARAAGRMVWWSGCGAGALVLLATRAGSGWSGLPSWAQGATVGVLGVAYAAVSIAAIADDVLPDALRPVEVAAPRGGLRRWTVVLAAALVPTLLVVLTPRVGWWQITSYQEVSGGFGYTETEVQVAGGLTLVTGENSSGRTVVMCRGLDCESGGDLDIHTDQTLSADGATVWQAHWEQAEDDHGAEAPDAEVELVLDSYDAGARFARLAGDDAADASRLTRNSVLSTTAGVLHPGRSHRTYDSQGVLAVAERDGTVVVLATGIGGTTNPLYLARCTAGECVTAETTISHGWVTPYSAGAVGIGPDGTAYAVIDNEGSSHQDRGLVMATMSPTGDLGTQFLAETGDVSTFIDTQGVSLAVGPDGTVWMLHLASPGRAELIRCDDATCSSRSTSVHTEIGQGTRVLAVDSSNRPLIATPDEAHGGVRLLGCADRDCTELSETTLWAETREPRVVGEWTDVRVGLGLDGDRPVIVVADTYRLAGGTRIVRCDAARCGAD